MARVLKTKELDKLRLATNYGGWMYCEACNENIGYLCYSTYDKLDLEFQCKCGSRGRALIEFSDSKEGSNASNELVVIKNRFCCPDDHEPLMTILDKKLASYRFAITCKACGKIYEKKIIL